MVKFYKICKRYYELLKQYQNIGKREFTLEEFKKVIGCKNKYEDFRNLKKFILDISKHELCLNTDICFEYEKITAGRKVIGTKFIINKKIDKDHLPLDLLYTHEEIESIKLKSGLSSEKFNLNQILTLYEIAVNKTDSSQISQFEYIRLNYEEVMRKNTVRNKFSY